MAAPLVSLCQQRSSRIFYLFTASKDVLTKSCLPSAWPKPINRTKIAPFISRCYGVRFSAQPFSRPCQLKRKFNINALPGRRQGLAFGLGGPQMFFVGTCVSTAVFAYFRLGIPKQAYCVGRLAQRIHADTDSKKVYPEIPWLEFFKLLLPEILFLLGAIVSAIAVAIVNIKIPLILGDLVNVVSKHATENVHKYLAEIAKPATSLLSMYGIQALLTTFYITMLSIVGERMAARLRTQLFSKIVCQDIAFFDSHRTGEIVNRLTSDVQELKSSFKMCISQGLRSLTQTVGCIVSLYLISPKLTTLMIIVVPSVIITGTLIGSILRKMSREAQAQIAKATAVADEALGNIRTVRSFAMENSEIGLFSREITLSSSLNQKLGLGIAVFQGLSNFTLNAIVLGTLYVGGHLLSKNEISPGDLMSFLVATQTIQRSLASMSLLFGMAVRGLTAGSRVFEYMGIEPLIPISGGKRIPYHSLFGDINFNNVTFRYPSRPEQVVLENFTIHFEKGKMLALCGLSGGGKSTVAKLLERFYEVEEGSITVDGVDIRHLDPAWLRGRLIGIHQSYLMRLYL